MASSDAVNESSSSNDVDCKADSANEKSNAEEHGKTNGQGFTWKVMLGTIRRQFPKAKQMSTESLVKLLNSEKKKDCILLLVSHDLIYSLM